MKGSLLTYYCMENNCGWEETSHKSLDGIRCPNCRGMVNVKPFKIDGNTKPSKPLAGRTKKDAGSTISITLDMESSKLHRQLRAIAKHTEALADELQEIDQSECPECGSRNTSVEETKAYSGSTSVLLNKDIVCFDCDTTSAFIKR